MTADPTDLRPTRARRAVARLRSLDPLTPLVGVTSLVVFALHGFGGFLARDLAIYAYAGQQVADGVPPYEGILNRAGPLAHLIPGLGVAVARLVGIDDLFGIRLLFMAISVACVCAVYVVARDVFASPLAGLAAASAFLSFAGFIEYATNGPREKTPMVLFLLLALWAMHHRRWLLGGFLLGLATLTLQIAFFVGAPALVVAALVARRGVRERVRALVRLIVGGVASLLLFVVYFLAVGALDAFVQAFLVINVSYTRAGNLDVTGDLVRLTNGFGFSTVVLAAGVLGVLWLAFWVWVRNDRSTLPAASTVAGLAAGLVSGLVWTLRDFDNWPDAFPVLPLAAVGMGGVVHLAVRRLPVRYAVSIVAAWTVAATSLAVGYSVTQRDDRLAAQERSVATVLGLVPDADILSIQAPQPLVISGQTNPSRHQMFGAGLDGYIEDTWPGGLDGFMASIREERPTLVAIGKPRIALWASMLKADYRRVGCARGWGWYADRSLDEATMTALVESTRDCRTKGPADGATVEGADRSEPSG